MEDEDCRGLFCLLEEGQEGRPEQGRHCTGRTQRGWLTRTHRGHRDEMCMPGSEAL